MKTLFACFFLQVYSQGLMTDSLSKMDINLDSNNSVKKPFIVFHWEPIGDGRWIYYRDTIWNYKIYP